MTSEACSISRPYVDIFSTNMERPSVLGQLRMCQQNTKAIVSLEVVPERRTERCSPRFWPGGRFWSQVSDTCRQVGRERNIGPQTIRDRVVSSTQLDLQLLVIPIYTTTFYLFPPCSTFKSVLRWCTSNDCGCALAETLLFMVLSHNKSCVFPYGTRQCILIQNT